MAKRMMKRRRINISNYERLNNAKGRQAFSNKAKFTPHKFLNFIEKNIKQVGENVTTTWHITERYRNNTIAGFKKAAAEGSFHMVTDTRIFNMPKTSPRTKFEIEMAIIEAQRQISQAQTRFRSEASFKAQETKIMNSLKNYLSGKTKTFRGKKFVVEADDMEKMEQLQAERVAGTEWFQDTNLRTSDSLFSNAVEFAKERGLI